MFRNDIPNRIKQPSQCCTHCGKSYKKRVNLDKHVIVCELLKRTTSSSSSASLIIEEDEPLPSQKKMFQMLIELGEKYNRLEKNVEEMKKWVVKKNKKINVLDWLNEHIKPNIVFDSLIDKINIHDDNDIINYIIENSVYDTINKLFSRTIYTFSENESPIIAFTQKPNIFYIYNSEYIWVEITREILCKFLTKIHIKINKAFYEWKKSKTKEIKLSDQFSIMCDKTMVKLMNIELKNENTLSKIKSLMYSCLKIDMKSLIEYDFEF